MIDEIRECVICGNRYQPITRRNKTCSKPCSEEYRRRYKKRFIKEHPELQIKWVMNWQRKNRDAVNVIARKRYQRDKDKIRVRNSTYQLLKSLGIKKEGKCMDCGNIKKWETHHITYTKDDFILLCRGCHLRRHKKSLRTIHE